MNRKNFLAFYVFCNYAKLENQRKEKRSFENLKEIEKNFLAGNYTKALELFLEGRQKAAQALLQAPEFSEKH